MCWLFHKWAKWSEPYPVSYEWESILFRKSGQGMTMVQKRVCLKCNKVQTREYSPIGR